MPSAKRSQRSVPKKQKRKPINPLKPLPVRASLQDFDAQARALLAAFRQGKPSAIQIVRQHHPQLPGRANTNDRNGVTTAQMRSTGVSRSDARTIVARWHGFASWETLKSHVRACARADSIELDFELAIEAIVTGNLATLKRLILKRPELIRMRSSREHRATLLHYIAANGVENYHQQTPANAVAICRFLLKAGAEVDADLDYGAGSIYPERVGSTALGLAATSYHPAAAGVQLPLLDVLLKAGAAIDGLPGGWNPLLAALHNGRGTAAAFLARRGARTDLESAAGAGQLSRVKQFFDAQGQLRPSASQKQLDAGFIWACQYGHRQVVSYLLKCGVKPDAQPHGQTGLHWAAYGGHPALVKLLLQHEPPLNQRDTHHQGTPLEWALYGWRNPPPESDRSNYYKVVSLLTKAGSTLDQSWLAARGLDQALARDSEMAKALKPEAR